MPAPTPALMINIVDGRWVAMISNTNVSFPFAGSTLEMQAQNVANLSLQMEMGLSEQLLQLFNSTGLGYEQLGQRLFGDTSRLLYEGTEIFAAEGDGSLLELLADAGEALAAAV